MQAEKKRESRLKNDKREKRKGWRKMEEVNQGGNGGRSSWRKMKAEKQKGK